MTLSSRQVLDVISISADIHKLTGVSGHIFERESNQLSSVEGLCLLITYGHWVSPYHVLKASNDQALTSGDLLKFTLDHILKVTYIRKRDRK